MNLPDTLAMAALFVAGGLAIVGLCAASLWAADALGDWLDRRRGGRS